MKVKAVRDGRVPVIQKISVIRVQKRTRENVIIRNVVNVVATVVPYSCMDNVEQNSNWMIRRPGSIKRRGR